MSNTSIELVVDSVAALRALGLAALNYKTVEVLNYHSDNVGGGGIFYWSPSSTTPDNSGTVIQPTGVTTGRYLRQVEDQNYNVQWFGARGDGVNDDSAAIQAAITSATQWSLVSLRTAPSSSEIVGGGTVDFPTTSASYVLSSQINITRSKLRIRGPARLNLANGITGFAFNFTGSSDKSWINIHDLDFVGGAVGIDIGLNNQPMPCNIYNCKFINQTSAGVRMGASGAAVTIRDNLFSGCSYGVWMYGQAADRTLIDHNFFIYNNEYDIYVEANNVFTISNNAFVSNFRPSNPSNIFVAVGSTQQVGAYSVICNNKFGPEGRTDGNCIRFFGTSSGAIASVFIHGNTFHYEASAVNAEALKIDGVQIQSSGVYANSLAYCKLFGTVNQENGVYQGENVVFGNALVAGSSGSQLMRGNFEWSELFEPPTIQKYNLLAFSRFLNTGSYTYNNVTSSFQTAVDENGNSNNASTFLGGSGGGSIQINSVDTNNQQQFYTMSIWVKADSEYTATVSLSRSSNYAIYKQFRIGTSWQRIVIPFYQTYLGAGNPYQFTITIDDGVTLTTGGICCVPGRDVGDLRKTNTTTEIYGLGVYTSGTPADIYWSLGTVAYNSSPASGQFIAKSCTVAGVGGTWVSWGNLP